MRLRSAIPALSFSLPKRLPRRLLTMVTVAGLLAACGGHGDKQFLIEAFQVLGQVNGYNDQANATADDKTGSPTAATLGGPLGNVATSLDGKTVFIADTGNYRVLGYSPLAASNGAPASFVLGQTSLSANVTATLPTQGTLQLPNSVSISPDGTKLVVADTGNNRVLIWNSIPTVTGTLPDVVVGQPDFVSSDSSTVSAASMRGPTAAIIVGNKLLVADKGNNRVLIWKTVPTANGAPADYQLGQVDLQTVCSSDTPICPGNATGGSVNTNTSSSGLYSPSSLWSDGSRLLVADTSNNRVLYWSVFPTQLSSNNQRGTAADFVIGQTDFNRNQPGTAATLLRAPLGVTSDGSAFYVADSGNNRVLKFNSMPQSNNPSATLVFGQYSTKFTAATPNDHDQNGTADDNPDYDTLSGPSGVYFDKATFTLYVTDTANNRVLLFPPSP